MSDIAVYVTLYVTLYVTVIYIFPMIRRQKSNYRGHRDHHPDDEKFIEMHRKEPRDYREECEMRKLLHNNRMEREGRYRECMF